MKKIIIFISSYIFSFVSWAQPCPGCIIDQSAFPPNPGPFDLGISPDTLYIIQGQATSQDITYLMPLQVSASGVTATVTEIQIVGVNGMPAGLQWTCDNFNNNCKYDPRVNRWGCVKVCGTTFDAPGVYTVTVVVIGTGCASGICQSQTNPIPFVIVIERDPAGGCASYFSFVMDEVCDQSNVTFTGTRVSLDPLVYPIEFLWNFDNGNTATGKNPPVQYYGSPGQYTPSVTINTLHYVVTAISATANGTWWCGDIEEPQLFGACTGSPDLFFKLTTGGNTITSNTINDNASPSWSGLNIPLASPAFSIQFMDEDGRCPIFCSPDDDGGTTIITINHNNGNNGAGIYNFSTSAPNGGGVTGTLTLALQVRSSDTCTDTFTIYQSPATPIITALGPTSLCVGDTLILIASSADLYRWYNDTALLGNTDSFLVVTRPGKYVVEVKNAGNSCTSLSDTTEVEFQQYPLPPVISIAGNDLVVNNPNNYVVQWFDNGTPILDATTDTLASPSGSGPFTATFSTTAGCTSESPPFLLCIAGTADPLSVDTITCCSQSPHTFTASASGFVIGSGSIIAWGITSAAEGPITSAADVQAAHAAGHVYLGDAQGSFDFSSCSQSLEEGLYYLTPFVIDNPSVDPLVYDTLNGCRPDAQLCPAISGSGWIINPLIFGFPDGSSFNVNQQFLFGADINEVLWTTLTANGPFCLALSTLYAGNPNGTWTISVTNTGTGTLDISVPAFEVRVSADSCAALNGTDQVVTINQVTATVAPGQTKTIVLEIPPLPASFPAVNPSCQAFGTAVPFYYKACPDDSLSSSAIYKYAPSVLQLYPNPNNGQFILELTSETFLSHPELSIYNSLGQLVWQERFSGLFVSLKQAITLPACSPGLYIANVKTNSVSRNIRFFVQ